MPCGSRRARRTTLGTRTCTSDATAVTGLKCAHGSRGCASWCPETGQRDDQRPAGARRRRGWAACCHRDDHPGRRPRRPRPGRDGFPDLVGVTDRCRGPRSQRRPHWAVGRHGAGAVDHRPERHPHARGSDRAERRRPRGDDRVAVHPADRLSGSRVAADPGPGPTRHTRADDSDAGLAGARADSRPDARADARADTDATGHTDARAGPHAAAPHPSALAHANQTDEADRATHPATAARALTPAGRCGGIR